MHLHVHVIVVVWNRTVLYSCMKLGRSTLEAFRYAFLFCSYLQDKDYLRYLRRFSTNSTDRLINRVSAHLLYSVH